VGTALAFSVAVKLLVVPMQLFRKQVNFRVLSYMLAGGLPGFCLALPFFPDSIHLHARESYTRP
jgi:uncharacterized protein